ncbi:hypothetical protein CE91St63_03740 [[Clostridium] hylemonae]|nr:hypothetical protein CE91St63_03740 [[Clostridium] hylemonae]
MKSTGTRTFTAEFDREETPAAVKPVRQTVSAELVLSSIILHFIIGESLI